MLRLHNRLVSDNIRSESSPFCRQHLDNGISTTFPSLVHIALPLHYITPIVSIKNVLLGACDHIDAAWQPLHRNGNTMTCKNWACKLHNPLEVQA